MDAVTLYRIVSLVSLWLAGTLGVACPILGYIDSDKQTCFVLLTRLSTGVVLGVVWLHLLADAQEQFSMAKVPGVLDGDDYRGRTRVSHVARCPWLSWTLPRLTDTLRNAVLLMAVLAAWA